MNHGAARLVAFGVTLAGTVLTFALLLGLERPGWVTHEYPAITVWTMPLAGLVACLAKPLRRWLAGRFSLVRVTAGLLIALALAVAWTFVAVALSGGYALAFDANPLLCWTVGSVTGLLTALLWPDMRRRQPVARQAAV